MMAFFDQPPPGSPSTSGCDHFGSPNPPSKICSPRQEEAQTARNHAVDAWSRARRSVQSAATRTRDRRFISTVSHTAEIEMPRDRRPIPRFVPGRWSPTQSADTPTTALQHDRHHQTADRSARSSTSRSGVRADRRVRGSIRHMGMCSPAHRLQCDIVGTPRRSDRSSRVGAATDQA